MAKTWIVCLLAVSMVAFMAGCKRTADDVVDDTIGALNDLTEVLKDVKDKASAEAAKPKIEKIVARAKDLQKEGEAMEKEMSKEENEALEKEYKPQVEKAVAAMQAEMMRIGQAAPDAMMIVAAAMAGMR